jgi:hypothetical protein
MSFSVKYGNIVDAVMISVLPGLITVRGFSDLAVFFCGAMAVSVFSALAVFLIWKIFSSAKEFFQIGYSIMCLFLAVAFEFLAAAFLRETGEVAIVELLSITIASIMWGRSFIFPLSVKGACEVKR